MLYSFSHSQFPIPLSVQPPLYPNSSFKRNLPIQTLHHPLPNDPLDDQILSQPPHHLRHLLDRQPLNRRLDHAAHARLIHGDEALVIHEREQAHDELAVHAIRDPAVAGDRLAKVLDFEGPFEARGEKSAKRGDEGGEGCEN